jgi:hypothetical protein
MEHLIRTYIITASETEQLLDVVIALDRKSLRINWNHHPSQIQVSTPMQVDGDEVAILSSSLTTDKKRCIVTVEYAAVRPSQIVIKLCDLLEPRLSQEEVKEATERAKAKHTALAQGRPMMCYTQVLSDEMDAQRKK